MPAGSLVLPLPVRQTPFAVPPGPVPAAAISGNAGSARLAFGRGREYSATVARWDFDRTCSRRRVQSQRDQLPGRLQS